MAYEVPVKQAINEVHLITYTHDSTYGTGEGFGIFDYSGSTPKAIVFEEDFGDVSEITEIIKDVLTGCGVVVHEHEFSDTDENMETRCAEFIRKNFYG